MTNMDFVRPYYSEAFELTKFLHLRHSEHADVGHTLTTRPCCPPVGRRRVPFRRQVIRSGFGRQSSSLMNKRPDNNLLSTPRAAVIKERALHVSTLAGI